MTEPINSPPAARKTRVSSPLMLILLGAVLGVSVWLAGSALIKLGSDDCITVTTQIEGGSQTTETCT